jgi:hypothetical protein
MAMAAIAGALRNIHGRERENQREREEKGSFVASLGISRGSSRPPSGKQEVVTASALRRTCRSLPPGGRRQVHFADSPLGFGGFSGNLKTVRFCKIW